jgi:methylmalonyl-CoA mutase
MADADSQDMSLGADLALGADFAPASREDWLKLVDGVLKGAPFEKLVAKTYDDLRVEPLYARNATARPIVARPQGAAWQVVQRLDHPDPAQANGEALHDLTNGANGLALVFGGAVGCYGYGIEATEAAIERVLDGVFLDAGVAIELDLSPQAKDAGRILADLLRRRGIAPAATDIRFGFDPLGAMAAAGGTALPWNELAPIFGGLISNLSQQGFGGPFAVADGRVVHAAGGSEAQELAFMLAVAVAYLRALEAAGIALDDARRMIFFRLAADADQFLGLAKFRALRKLWARVAHACGLGSRPAFISAETAWRMMTRRDPWVNLLRTTMAVFAAGLGGANSITVLPFTAALGLPDRFARRLARNTQLILLEESNLAKVGDPAAGAGGLEDLTDRLCTTAWTLFQSIEAAGGIAVALERGIIQELVAKVRVKREQAAATRRDAITGTSEFPDIAETPVSVLDVPPVAAPPCPVSIAFPALARLRLAAPFEELRDASDRLTAKTGAQPKVFLATLGRLSEFTARASFARNFFEAGGIAAVTGEGFAGHAEMLAAFAASGAKLACLCSSDEVYGREAVAATEGLARAGAHLIYLAGRPKEQDALRAAGVQAFIYAGCDALATLKAAHAILDKAA